MNRKWPKIENKIILVRSDESGIAENGVVRVKIVRLKQFEINNRCGDVSSDWHSESKLRNLRFGIWVWIKSQTTKSQSVLAKLFRSLRTHKLNLSLFSEIRLSWISQAIRAFERAPKNYTTLQLVSKTTFSLTFLERQLLPRYSHSFVDI